MTAAARLRTALAWTPYAACAAFWLLVGVAAVKGLGGGW